MAQGKETLVQATTLRGYLYSYADCIKPYGQKNLCDVASPKPSILDGYFGIQINSAPYIFLQVL